MKIGLIGPPGSGKTVLAEKLQARLGDNVVIIDGYVEEIEEQADLALGSWATYIGNLMVAMGRVQRERWVMKDPEAAASHTITCGTIIDTLTYAAVDGLNRSRYQDEITDAYKRAIVLMPILGVMVIDTMNYDRIIYLPGKIPEPGVEEATFNEVIAQELPSTIESFYVPHLMLSSLEDEDIDKAMEYLLKDD